MRPSSPFVVPLIAAALARAVSASPEVCESVALAGCPAGAHGHRCGEFQLVNDTECDAGYPVYKRAGANMYLYHISWPRARWYVTSVPCLLGRSALRINSALPRPFGLGGGGAGPWWRAYDAGEDRWERVEDFAAECSDPTYGDLALGLGIQSAAQAELALGAAAPSNRTCAELGWGFSASQAQVCAGPVGPAAPRALEDGQPSRLARMMQMAEAAGFCAAQGARLCTASELQYGVAFNAALETELDEYGLRSTVWSDTPCLIPMATRGGGEPRFLPELQGAMHYSAPWIGGTSGLRCQLGAPALELGQASVFDELREIDRDTVRSGGTPANWTHFRLDRPYRTTDNAPVRFYALTMCCADA